MQLYIRKLLVVICEAALEKPLVAELGHMGATGYTIADVRGGGRGGPREGSWEGDRSIELKVVCESDVAERLSARILANWCPHYAITMYLSDVEILRPGKF